MGLTSGVPGAGPAHATRGVAQRRHVGGGTPSCREAAADRRAPDRRWSLGPKAAPRRGARAALPRAIWRAICCKGARGSSATPTAYRLRGLRPGGGWRRALGDRAQRRRTALRHVWCSRGAGRAHGRAASPGGTAGVARARRPGEGRATRRFSRAELHDGDPGLRIKFHKIVDAGTNPRWVENALPPRPRSRPRQVTAATSHLHIHIHMYMHIHTHTYTYACTYTNTYG